MSQATQARRVLIFGASGGIGSALTTMKPLHQSFAMLASMMHIVTLPAAAESATWPQWRGPERNGQVTGPSWPARLDTNQLQQTWRVELGPSYSGPIVAGDRVFTTETKDK